MVNFTQQPTGHDLRRYHDQNLDVALEKIEQAVHMIVKEIEKDVTISEMNVYSHKLDASVHHAIRALAIGISEQCTFIRIAIAGQQEAEKVLEFENPF